MEKEKLENDYLYKNFGIRNDYLYEILFYPQLDIEDKSFHGDKRKSIIIGEILNFNCNQFFIKSYDEDGNNHYILTLGSIIGMQPYKSIEEYNN